MNWLTRFYTSNRAQIAWVLLFLSDCALLFAGSFEKKDWAQFFLQVGILILITPIMFQNTKERNIQTYFVTALGVIVCIVGFYLLAIT